MNNNTKALLIVLIASLCVSLIGCDNSINKTETETEKTYYINELFQYKDIDYTIGDVTSKKMISEVTGEHYDIVIKLTIKNNKRKSTTIDRSDFTLKNKDSNQVYTADYILGDSSQIGDSVFQTDSIAPDFTKTYTIYFSVTKAHDEANWSLVMNLYLVNADPEILLKIRP